MKPCIPQSWHPRRRDAFTLIELLVVIAIIALLGALVAGLATRSSEKKVKSLATVLLKQVELAIGSYQDKLGVLPPDNPGNPARPPLFYSLKGVLRDDMGNYETHENQPLRSGSELLAEFGPKVQGFINSGLSRADFTDFASNLKESHVDKDSNGFRFIVMPYKGPEGEFNPVRYDASSANRHNRNGYDLWVEVVIGNKTNIIGNW